MSATSDFMDFDAVKAKPEGCGNLAFRGISMIFGASLLIAAVGLWLVPGSSFSAEVLLIKLGLTGLFALGGISFIQASRCRARRS